jgi:hypothetical protein
MITVDNYIIKKNKILNTMSPLYIFREIGLAERLWI